LLPTPERATVYAWRRHLAAEVGRALFTNGSGLDVAAESRLAAVGFIDLAGYTRQSRNVGLTELAWVLDQFETVVLDTVVAHGIRVIKNLRDEILFVIDDPTAAAEATLELVDFFTADDALPRVQAGLAFGPLLDRGGDVYGPVVNVAARLASLARKGTIRVDQAMAVELHDAKQFALSGRAPRRVRGYLQLASYRLRRAGSLDLCAAHGTLVVCQCRVEAIDDLAERGTDRLRPRMSLPTSGCRSGCAVGFGSKLVTPGDAGGRPFSVNACSGWLGLRGAAGVGACWFHAVVLDHVDYGSRPVT
jgi:class 3 adenylate cyclase